MKIGVITGAGISAESGLATFRDKGGLWDKYDFQTLASIDGWYQNPALVLEFYNVRRQQLVKAQPNNAHKALAELQKHHEVVIVTQNVDDLHERAGSNFVLHLHGEIMKACSEDKSLVYDTHGNDINIGDFCENGTQLRPAVVWFGESVPNMDKAIETISSVDRVLVVGTSLAVYPAASLIDYIDFDVPITVVDPNMTPTQFNRNIEIINEKAGDSLPALLESWASLV